MAAPGSPSRAAPRRSTIVAAALAILAAASFAVDPVAWAAGHIREGFPSYFTAARLVAEGRWSPSVYDDRTFANETLEVTGGRIGELYRPNPPVASLLMLPLADLDLLTARRAWLALEVVLVVVTWWLLLAAIPRLRAPPIALSGLALILVWAPLREDVSMGQVYVPLLALHAAAFFAIQRGRGWTAGISAGIALGAAAAAKLAALPWLLVAGVRREGRILIAAAATVAVLVVVTLILARAFGFALAGWVVAVTILVARRARADLAAGLAVAASVLALNVAQGYTHTLMVLPAAVAIGRALEPPGGGRARTAWLAIAIALIAAPLPYRDPALNEGWLALLAYPRVYGAWLLWAWLAREVGLELRARVGLMAAAGGEAAPISEARRRPDRSGR